jgi:SAM-dependent methyltransferase
MNPGYRKLRLAIRKVVPEPVLAPMARAKAFAKVSAARLAFSMTARKAEPLPIDLLESMAASYPEPPKIRYDPEGLVLRAKANVHEMEAWLDLSRIRSSLELGCMDGMVSAALAEKGIKCFALDISRGAFDQRGREAGVTFVQGDATRLPFASGAFGLIFSFASYEHFGHPWAVLQEAARILSPGGWLYLQFGPIATAPYGLHAYRSITVPYVHILFDLPQVIEFARLRGRQNNWPYINNVPLREYRRMFNEAKRDFKVARYQEHPSAGVGAELIFRYPGVFRRVSDSIADFLVSGIAVLLERR